MSKGKRKRMYQFEKLERKANVEVFFDFDATDQKHVIYIHDLDAPDEPMVEIRCWTINDAKKTARGRLQAIVENKAR